MLYYWRESEDGNVVVDIGLGVVRPPDHALHPDGLGADGLRVAGEVVLAQADHEVGGSLHAVHGCDGVPLDQDNKILWLVSDEPCWWG